MLRLIALPAVLAMAGCAGSSSNERGTPPSAVDPSPSPTPAATPRGETPVPPLEGALVHEFSGDWFLQGTLTKARAGEPDWLMSGTMQFPTGGFTVGKAIVRQTRSMPDQVSITIPVTPPPKDALVTQAIVEHRIEERVPGTDRAVFRVVVETAERK